MTQTFTMDYRDIEAAIPHRPPFLLIDKVIDIVPGQSATGIKAVSGGGSLILQVISQGTQYCLAC